MALRLFNITSALYVALFTLCNSGTTFAQIQHTKSCQVLLEELGASDPIHPKLKLTFGYADLSVEKYEDLLSLPADVAAKKYGLTVTYVTRLQQLSPSMTMEIVKTIFEVDEVFQGKIERPKTLELNVDYSQPGSSKDNRINVPYRALIKTAKQIIDRSLEDVHPSNPSYSYGLPEDTRGVDAHEYGHQIFHVMLSKTFPQLDQWTQEELDAARSTEIKFANQLAKYEKLKAMVNQQVTPSDQSLGELEQAEGEANRLGGEVLSWNTGEIGGPRPLTITYNELFADLVAVITLGSPTALSITKNHPDPEINRLALIDFSAPRDVEGWTEIEEHRALDPTRYFLWNEYLSKTNDRKEQADIAAIVLNTMMEEIGIRYQFGEYRLSTPETNQRLITRLKQRLGPPPLQSEE